MNINRWKLGSKILILTFIKINLKNNLIDIMAMFCLVPARFGELSGCRILLILDKVPAGAPAINRVTTGCRK